MKIGIRTFSSKDNADEAPLELLSACHEKIRHFVRLAEKLAEHLKANGADAEAQQAAASVLRYFEQALPLHHLDEEADVFPALHALGEPALNSAIVGLLTEHAALDVLWRDVQPWLADIKAGKANITAPSVLAQFVSGYAAHTANEERDVFPALTRLSAATTEAIAQNMRERRGQK